MDASPESRRFWRRYLSGVADPQATARRYYGAFRIGDSEQSANRGAALILQGVKTATSTLHWEYEAGGRAPPAAGALSVVEGGRGEPVCVVETTEVRVLALEDLDAAFARDHGEWGRSLETWRARALGYYAARCRALGRVPGDEMPLVCERFRVVFP